MMHRGSTWNIWDFHLHTPHSILNNQFGNPEDETTWDSYVNIVESKAKELGIKAIGITDYFTIEGYKRVIEYQRRGRLQDLLIFPNIEFRVDTIVEKKRLNYHVLFSPDVPINYIEEHFLHDLDFVHEEQPFQDSNTRKLKLTNLQDFGENLRQQHSSFRSKTSLEIGCMTAKVKLEDIKHRLSKDGRFSGKYLLVLAEENMSLLSWDGQDHATRKQLIQMSHAIFSSNDGTRAFCLGKKHKKTEEYIDEFKSFKPCLWGCDSHGFEQRFLEPNDKRYCWIKGEVSWEGLRQVLFEPEHRVRIQQNSPEHTKSYYTLDSVNVESTQLNNSLSIDNINIHLNPNLVAVIGGRGSGKTALLDLVASCFPEGKKLAKLDNSFYHRLYGTNKRQPENAKPVSMNLRFRSEDEFSKQIGQEDIFFQHSDVLYLTQNHMDDYTANPAKLNEHIIELVFDQNPDKRSGYNDLHQQAQNLRHSIQSLNLEIEQIRQQVSKHLSSAKTEHTKKQGELTDYQSRLQEQESQQLSTNKETALLTDKLKLLKSQRDQMIVFRERLNKLRIGVKQFHEQYEKENQEINAQLTGLSYLHGLAPLPVLSQLNIISDVLSQNMGLVQETLPLHEKEISSIVKSLGKLDGIDRTIAQLRRTIDGITNEIKVVEERITELHDMQRRIVAIDQQRVEIYAELMQKTVETSNYLQQMINQFETGQFDLLKGISFSALVDTNVRKDYIDVLVDKVDGRAHSYEVIAKSLNQIIDDADRVLNSTDSDQNSVPSETILQLAQKLRDWTNDIRLKKSSSESEFFNAVFSPFFRIGLHIEFNRRPLETLSMGERAVVLLKILLGLDDKPLLIDQPEEHLDNRYIYDELTPAFRSAKTRRQIIIATHNANLVVNTDAEQIIVAEHIDGKLCYQVGTLEDLNVRESIKTILEGGDQAFKKREEKYGYLF